MEQREPSEGLPHGAIPGIRPGHLVTGGLVPFVVFYAALRLWGLGPAVALGLVTAGTALVYRLYRDRRVDPVSTASFALTGALGALALSSRTANVFLAEPAVSNVVVGLVLLGSVALRRPLLGLVAGYVYRPAAVYARSREGTFAFGVVTAAWGLTNLARGGTRLYLLNQLGTGEFLLANVLLGWPVSAPLALASYLYLRWHARRARQLRP